MTDAPQVFVNEGTFGVLDDGEIAVETADWSNGLVVPMAQGALIVTGINTGNVRVSLLPLEGPPVEAPAESWEEIVEVSLHAPKSNLQLESLEFGAVAPATRAESASSWYRLRVHARGREVLRDKVSLDPVEDYLLISWPAARQGAVVLRSSESIERRLHAQPATTVDVPAPRREENPPVHKPG
ncbi:hypothetical protein ABT275_41770 [Streptomyces sp. NPDC001185]|uniref:hypothetical protein n=1 Tax=Streptomyces sp. NPDC001185 TaxID=3154380 RepID=UPI003321F154